MDKINNLIERYKIIIEKVNEEFIKEGQPVIIMDSHEYFREVMSLYCRQQNLLEATFVLLKSNMAEEAYILFRSLINNHIVILYLLSNYTDKEKFYNYILQPLVSRKLFLKNLLKISKESWFKQTNDKICIDDVKKELHKIKEKLQAKKVESINYLSVAGMSKTNSLLFGIYATEYQEASKWEHSDPSTTGYYREPIINNYSPEVVFKFNLSKSSTKLKEKVFKLSTSIFSFTFIEITKHIRNEQQHLLKNYDEKKLAEIMIRMTTFDEEIKDIEV